MNNDFFRLLAMGLTVRIPHQKESPAMFKVSVRYTNGEEFEVITSKPLAAISRFMSSGRVIDFLKVQKLLTPSRR